jgi:mannose-6-phosphate isomerase-like protein (cupin superfamily)
LAVELIRRNQDGTRDRPVDAQEAHRRRRLGGEVRGEFQESRFAKDDLEAEQTGLTHHRIKAGKRQGFAHRHEQAEEVYVVLSGSGRVKLDDDIVDVEPLDAIRVAPTVTRTFEAGADGLELLAVGPHRAGDGDVIRNWWTD